MSCNGGRINITLFFLSEIYHYPNDVKEKAKQKASGSIWSLSSSPLSIFSICLFSSIDLKAET